MSHFYGTECEIWAGFGLVFGRLAVLKISDWAVKYATFEGNFLCFHGQFFFFNSLKNIVVPELKSCVTYR